MPIVRPERKNSGCVYRINGFLIIFEEQGMGFGRSSDSSAPFPSRRDICVAHKVFGICVACFVYDLRKPCQLQCNFSVGVGAEYNRI